MTVLPESESQDTDTNPLLPRNLRTPSPISVSLFITSPDEYTLRANSLPTYLLLNHHLALSAPDPKKHPSSTAGPKTSVGQDSLVAENCSLGERVQIRKSVLSANVQVGSRSVVRGSVVMSDVSIGENAKIEGCVLCKGAKIEDNVTLTDCYVGAGYIVEKGTKMSKQNLVELDELEDDEEED
jgi:translation initiation factor eIF-2B subunit gamma